MVLKTPEIQVPMCKHKPLLSIHSQLGTVNTITYIYGIYLILSTNSREGLKISVADIMY
jgi:hypothetical protein